MSGSEKSVLNFSIDDLEKSTIKDHGIDSTLAEKCRKLTATKLKDLTNENLRLLIGQKIGLQYVLPIALDALLNDPLASGDLYRGDLLHTVIGLPDDFWKANPALNNEMVEVRQLVEELHETLSQQIIPKISRFGFQKIT